MTQTTSSTVATSVNTQLIARHAQTKMTFTPVVTQFVNVYPLPANEKKIRLNTESDIGTASSYAEGYTLVDADFDGLTYDAAVELEPDIAAYKAGDVTDKSKGESGNVSRNVLESGDLKLVKNFFGPEAARLFSSVRRKIESDCVATFANASQVSGSTGVAFGITNIEEMIYLLSLSDSDEEGYVGCLDKRQISDLRREMAVTAGGLQGSVHIHSRVDHVASGNGYAFASLGVPLFSIAKKCRLTANAAADVMGALFIPGFGTPEQGGGGQHGAIAMATKGDINLEIGRRLRGSAYDLVARASYDVAERRDDYIVAGLSKI